MKKLISIVLFFQAFLYSYDKYDYEFSPAILYTDEIKANRDTFYPNYGLSIAKNINIPLFDQIELSLYKSKKISYKNSTINTYINRYLINFYQNRKVNEDLILYSLFGLGFQEFTKKLSTSDTKYINYGFGLKYKLFKDNYLKTDVRHLIQSETGEHSFMYNLAISIPFGKKSSIRKYFIIDKENNDFTPFR